jgi:uncharacterized DUF497 family protein
VGYSFEWDSDKAASNLKDDKVSFDEATTVFADLFALNMLDHGSFRGRATVCGTRNVLSAQGTHVVLLDPDVAELFPDARVVNEALRTLTRPVRVKRPSRPRHKRTA